MPGIPDHILEQVRAANDLVEVIGASFPLKRRGANFIALCPFHKEKTPSFNVNPTRQIWKCFGCGAGGDVFGFVMKHENLPFMDAVRRLAERGGVRLEFEEKPGAPTRDEKELLFKLHDQVAGFFHQHLLQQPATSPVQMYLKKRGIGSDTVKRWRIGYAPNAWDALLEWARPKKYTPAMLASAGLVLPRESGEGYYDRFRDRLMFPIGDDQGRVVAFSGRILTDAKDQPKYVNSPETAIFQKGRLLFALDRAKRSIGEEHRVVVCEGQLDTISCHEAGFSNVVAPQGTAFTEQHARILKRHTDETILMFDGDEAGQNAAVRNAEPLWELGMIVRVALLPAEHDPDSFLKAHGAAKLRALLDGAQPFYDFLLARLSRLHDARTDRGRRQIAEEMVPWLCRLRDPIQQASFVQRTATRLDVREEAVRQAMKHFLQRGSRARTEAETEVEDEARPVGLPAERTLLQLMLADERVVEVVAERLDREWLTDGLAGDLMVHVLDLHVRRAWNGAPSLLTATNDAGQGLVAELLLEALPGGEPAVVATECVVAIERHYLEARMRQLRKQLAAANLPATRTAELQQQVLDLRRRLDHIAAPLRDRTTNSGH